MAGSLPPLIIADLKSKHEWNIIIELYIRHYYNTSPITNEIVSNMLFTISHLHCCMVCMAIGILNLKALYLDSYLET